jgi:hypothetical protein
MNSAIIKITNFISDMAGIFNANRVSEVEKANEHTTIRRYQMIEKAGTLNDDKRALKSDFNQVKKDIAKGWEKRSEEFAL